MIISSNKRYKTRGGQVITINIIKVSNHGVSLRGSNGRCYDQNGRCPITTLEDESHYIVEELEDNNGL